MYRERFLQFFFGINWLFSTFTNPLSILHKKSNQGTKGMGMHNCTYQPIIYVYPGLTFMSFSTTFIWETG